MFYFDAKGSTIKSSTQILKLKLDRDKAVKSYKSY